VTRWSGCNRVNVNKAAWIGAHPDYLVALTHIGGKYVMLCGAMPFSKVNSYVGGQYDVTTTKPFLSIPLEHLPIKAKTLYTALLEAKGRVDALNKIAIE
jgi:hypothetical protein